MAILIVVIVRNGGQPPSRPCEFSFFVVEKRYDVESSCQQLMSRHIGVYRPFCGRDDCRREDCYVFFFGSLSDVFDDRQRKLNLIEYGEDEQASLSRPFSLMS